MGFDIKYEIVDDFDKIIEEKGNTFIALRKLKWGDRDAVKLDLRKYFISSTGEETVGKGVSFQTEEGPHELVRAMVECGYGKTDEVLQGIKDREDFRLQLNRVLGKDDESYDEEVIDDEELYVPSMELML